MHTCVKFCHKVKCLQLNNMIIPCNAETIVAVSIFLNSFTKHKCKSFKMLHLPEHNIVIATLIHATVISLIEVLDAMVKTAKLWMVTL